MLRTNPVRALPLFREITAYPAPQFIFVLKVLCEVLGISRGAYSNRVMHNREPTYWSQHREKIKRHIIKIYDKSIG